MPNSNALTPACVAKEGNGLGLSIAVVDSGVNFDHPHLGVRGQSFEVFRDEDGVIEVRNGPVRDEYGHGTCCAALIHYLAPQAALISVKVTGECVTTDADRLAVGIRTSLEFGADIICVPMATETPVRRALDEAVTFALKAGSLVIAADPGSTSALPAGCPGALPVQWSDGVDVVFKAGAVCADGRARAFAEAQRNFRGPSLSAARAAAAVARFGEISGLRGEALLGGFKKRLGVL